MIYGAIRHYEYSINEQLRTDFPRLTQGRRRFVIREVLRYCAALPHEVFGVAPKHTLPVTGDYMLTRYIDIKGYRIHLWIAVG